MYYIYCDICTCLNSILISELADQLDDLHLAENEGYLGRKSRPFNNFKIPPVQRGPNWELSYFKQELHKTPPRTPMRHETLGRLFEFVPLLRPKIGSEVPKRSGDSPQPHELFIQSRSKTTGDSVFLTARSDSRGSDADMIRMPYASTGYKGNKGRWKG